MSIYTCLHIHSELSNPMTIFDSSTNYKRYVDKALENNMNAIAFTEHGNILSWYEKKNYCEKNGLKYIHGVEAYMTHSHSELVADNYHICLYAKNKEGFYELNELISKTFNREGNCVIDNVARYYYKPRLSVDELISTSDNIIITSACLGGAITKNTKEKSLNVFNKVLNFFCKNKHRCFLEMQPHKASVQVEHNKFMLELHKEHGIDFTIGTDTHNATEENRVGRSVMQKRKHVHFEEEEAFNLDFMTYEDIVNDMQSSGFSIDDIKKGLEQTNIIANMCEEYSIDTSFKYPKLYKNPEKEIKEKIMDGYKKRIKYLKNFSHKEIKERINEELEVYKKVNLIDFTLLRKELVDWEHSKDIYCGYARGSVSGSMIAYLLNITDINPMEFKLNFFRYANPSRVSLADIDTDYFSEDKELVDSFLLKDKMNRTNINTCRIITFNRLALRGAIRDVFPTFGYSPSEIDEIVKEVENDIGNFENDFESDFEVIEDYQEINLDTCGIVDKYKKEFAIVKSLMGAISSVGNHPAGVVITDRNMCREFGTFTTSKCDFPISQVDMKSIDSMGYVKLDNLGLKNMGLINKTCLSAKIDRITPNNMNFEDDDVWEDISKDVTGIFQMESALAAKCLKSIMSKETIKKIENSIGSVSRIKLLSFTNGLIRPSCASFRDNAMTGEFNHSGVEEIDLFLKETLGRLVMQEQIMEFLVKFCGYNMAESDSVRRAIAKKYGTESLLPEIKSRFIKTAMDRYGMKIDECEKVINPMIKAILDASDYGFSQNHSDAYSCIGYACGYLRYHYPLQFISNYINIFKDDNDKILNIKKYGASRGVEFKEWTYGKSKKDCFFDEHENCVYSGLSMIKGLPKSCGDELYELSKKNKHNDFVSLLRSINENTSLGFSGITTLIMLGYFREFGNSKKLILISDMFDKFFGKSSFKKTSEYVSFSLEHKFPKGYENDFVRNYNVPIKAIKKYCEKETDKTISKFDSLSFLEYVEKNAKNVNAKTSSVVKFQSAYSGGIYYVDKQLKNTYVVTKIKEYERGAKCNAYIDIYSIEDGSVLPCRISNNTPYKKGSLKNGDVIIVSHSRNYYKKKKVDGKWETTNELGYEIISYTKEI